MLTPHPHMYCEQLEGLEEEASITSVTVVMLMASAPNPRYMKLSARDENLKQRVSMAKS